MLRFRSGELRGVVVAAAICAASAHTTWAEIGQDIHVQETGEIRVEIDDWGMNEIDRMMKLGYPAAFVMMNSVSAGMSLNDIVYLATRSDPARAEEFYTTALALLPALPGWVCQEEQPERYTRGVTLSELGGQPTLRQVANLFFAEDRRVVPHPDWIASGRGHMTATIGELAALAGDEYWYIPGADDGTLVTSPNRPVFASIYRNGSRIVIDRSVEQISEARQEGAERLPVVLVYNDSTRIPISRYDPEVTVKQLADSFFADGLAITSVPEWHRDDHHKTASLAELLEVVDLADKKDVSDERWTAIESKLTENGMRLDRPLILTVFRSGAGKVWVDRPDVLAVAASLGIDQFPIVLLFHTLDRQVPGELASCEPMICQAALAAGAPTGLCDQTNASQQ